MSTSQVHQIMENEVMWTALFDSSIVKMIRPTAQPKIIFVCPVQMFFILVRRF